MSAAFERSKGVRRPALEAPESAPASWTKTDDPAQSRIQPRESGHRATTSVQSPVPGRARVFAQHPGSRSFSVRLKPAQNGSAGAASGQTGTHPRPPALRLPRRTGCRAQPTPSGIDPETLSRPNPSHRGLKVFFPGPTRSESLMVLPDRSAGHPSNRQLLTASETAKPNDNVGQSRTTTEQRGRSTWETSRPWRW